MRKLTANKRTLRATDVFKHTAPAKIAINHAVAFVNGGAKQNCTSCRDKFEVAARALSDALVHLEKCDDLFSVVVVEKQQKNETKPELRAEPDSGAP